MGMDNPDKSPENLKNLYALTRKGHPDKNVYQKNFYHDKKIADSENIQKLLHFSDCIRHGVLPDGDVLEYIANGIEQYANEEFKTLEDSLGLEAVKGIGNAAKVFNLKKERVRLFMLMIGLIVEENLLLEDAAERILEEEGINQQDIVLDPVSFLRDFRDKFPDRNSMIEFMKEKFGEETEVE